MIQKYEGFDVYLNGKWIDKVFATGYTVEEMRLSLIHHDMYDPGIVVRKERKAREVSK